MTQNSSKIQGKFYPLQHEEWLKACRELTPAQKDVLYYIRTLDPYGDGVELSVSGIARQLSTENKEVHRSTVSRALKALDDKGFVDLELLKVKVKILAGGLHCCDETTVLPTDNTVAYRQQARSLRNKRDHDATDAIATQQPSSESLAQSQSSDPKTYSDFIQTLSEEERASFLNFCVEKTKNLSQPVNDIEAWLAHKNKAGKNRWEVYYEKFLDSQHSSSKKSRNSQIAKKLQQEIEEQRLQAIENLRGKT
ncbi:MarR family transcriptional regulator [Fortiea contorta]|uniref:MarR family transcriptional regulator n=1 Tax=Fortiea contorta TaxID=1892405 RepID=UPI0003488279|nr:helix-turn-helix domain-containing protein [Fortiea contorta]